MPVVFEAQVGGLFGDSEMFPYFFISRRAAVGFDVFINKQFGLASSNEFRFLLSEGYFIKQLGQYLQILYKLFAFAVG